MSNNIKMEDLVSPASTSDTGTGETQTEVETEVKVETKQDPLKTELEKVKGSSRTEKEKAEFSFKKTAERIRELGGDPASVLGINPNATATEDDEDTKPVTKGELRKIISQGATKTALQMADEISNETERELTKHYLENRIIPSGDATQDLRDARRMVNAIKNEQILNEVARKGPAATHSTSSSQPALDNTVKGELTAQELLFTKPPFSMTKEQILKARK